VVTSEKWYRKWSRVAPWYFHSYAHGRENVVVAHDRQIVAVGGRPDLGALRAAAPTMYATLYQIARTLHPHDPRTYAIRRALARADARQGKLAMELPPERER
jgi:hypothetical protein